MAVLAGALALVDGARDEDGTCDEDGAGTDEEVGRGAEEAPAGGVVGTVDG